MGNKRAKKQEQKMNTIGLAHNDKIEYSVFICSQHHCKQYV